MRLGFGWGCPARRPSGYRRRYDDGGVRGGGGCWWWGAPFECPQDRLRQAQGERCREAALRRGVGEAIGEGDAPPRAPLGSCLRRNDARGGVREGRWWVWGSASAAGGGGRSRCGGTGGSRTAPTRFGESGKRLGFGWGAPPGAPLDTGFRRYDDGGVRGGGGCWWGGAPSSALRTGFDRLRANGVGERPYDGEGGTEAARAAPLWVPAFAGMTLVGECGNDDGGVWGSARVAGGGGVRVPLRRGRAVREPPLRGLESRGSDWGLGGGAPPGAPLDTGAGTTMGGCGAAGGVGGGGPPFECPQDRLRQAQGERCREAALRRGVGEAIGEGDAPPRAPSGFLPSQE